MRSIKEETSYNPDKVIQLEVFICLPLMQY